MPKICFLLNSVPDTWVNFFPSPENFNSLLQDELSNSSPHAVQPSLCLPWLCGTSCIRNLPFFPNRPCLILPSCPGLFCFPFFEGLLFSLWLCKVYRHSRPHTHASPPSLISPKSISAIRLPFIKSFNKCWLRITYVPGVVLRQTRSLVLWMHHLDGKR